MAAWGSTSVGFVRKLPTNCITIDITDVAHKPEPVDQKVYAQLAALLRYRRLCPFLARTAVNPQLESPYRDRIPKLPQTTY